MNYLNPRTESITRFGILLALSMLFGYIETLIPVGFWIPGAKLGLANAVIMVGMYRIGEKESFVVSLLRVFLVSISFGNFVMLWYSLAGAMCSFLFMVFCKRLRLLSVIGNSMLGGVCHNLGQLFIAMLFLRNASLLLLAPQLMLFGIISGLAIGVVAGNVILRIQGDKNGWGG